MYAFGCCVVRHVRCALVDWVISSEKGCATNQRIYLCFVLTIKIVNRISRHEKFRFSFWVPLASHFFFLFFFLFRIYFMAKQRKCYEKSTILLECVRSTDNQIEWLGKIQLAIQCKHSHIYNAFNANFPVDFQDKKCR